MLRYMKARNGDAMFAPMSQLMNAILKDTNGNMLSRIDSHVKSAVKHLDGIRNGNAIWRNRTNVSNLQVLRPIDIC